MSRISPKFKFPGGLFLALLLLCLATSCASPVYSQLLDKKSLADQDSDDRIEILLDFQDTLRREDLAPEDRAKKKKLIGSLTSLAHKDFSPLVRALALETLSLLVGFQGQDHYLKALEDRAFIVRYTSLKILRRHGGKGAYKPLVKVLKEDLSFHCRREAARALVNFEKASMVKTLVSILDQEENEGVQYAIYRLLLRLTREKIPFDPARWKEWHRKRQQQGTKQKS